MRKVIPLRTNGSVQDCLCRAAEEGLTDVIIMGRRQDGFYHMWMSGIEDTPRMVGMLRMAEHDLLTAMEG